MVGQIILSILPIIATAMMGYIVWLLKESKIEREKESKKRDANSEGTRLILLYMLERMHTEYTLQEYVTHEQRTQFYDMYEAYHNLGGNGYGTKLWTDIDNLEIRNDKESVSPFARMLKEELQGGKE